MLAILDGCRTPKLAEADEQYDRGEYYNASKTYRKVYNSLKKREERPARRGSVQDGPLLPASEHVGTRRRCLPERTAI